MDDTKTIKPHLINRVILGLLPNFLRKRFELKGEPVKVLNNIGWLLADKFIQIILGVLVGAWVARYLGPSSFGQLSYIVAIVGIFKIIAQLGINNIAVRDLASTRYQLEAIMGTLFRLKTYSGILCFVCVLALMKIMGSSTTDFLIAAIIAGGLIFQISDAVDLWFQSNLQSKNTIQVKLATCIISNAIKIMLILLNMPLIAFAVAILFESIIFTIILVHSYNKFSPVQYGYWDKALCIKMISEGFPFLASGLLLTAYIQLDKVLLVKIGSTSEAGYYTAAITISSAINFLPMIVCSSLAPVLAKIESNAGQNSFFLNLYSFLFWVSVPATTLLFIFAEKIVALLYGESYLSSALTLKILALSITPIFLSVANDYLALCKKASSTTLLRTILGLTINLTLNILLIPRYGAIGAGISIVIAHWFSNTFFYWFIMKNSFALQIKGICSPFFYVADRSKSI